MMLNKSNIGVIVAAIVVMQIGLAAGLAADERSADQSPMALNEKAWNLFLHSTDRRELDAAVRWMKEVVSEIEGTRGTPEYHPEVYCASVDTYANLLYKVGRVDDAIEWQGKAVAAAESSSTREFLQGTLEKMKSGVPTWPETTTESEPEGTDQ